RQAGIELSGAVPDLHVSFLNNLLGEILSAQDTEDDAIEFRARRGIEALESGLVSLRNRGNQPDQLSRRQHSRPPKPRSPIAFFRARSSADRAPTGSSP